MKKIKNITVFNIEVFDVGITIPANDEYTIPPQDYPLWAASNDIVTFIGSGDIVVNDGSFDLDKAFGISLLQGNFKQADFIDDLKTNDSRLKVDVLFNNTGDERVKVSGDDTTTDFLEDKILGTANKINITAENPGEYETLKVNIGSDVFDKAEDDTGDITEGSNLFFTDERAQNAVGNILIDSSSIDFNYSDSANEISAEVLPTGVDHNSLQNYVVNKHIDHSNVNINAGTGLSGGGDITASRTLNIANTSVSAGSYGSPSQVAAFTVNAQGQLTSASNITINQIQEKFSLNNSSPSNRVVGIYSGIISTTGSDITFHCTSDGTASGAPLFDNLTLTSCVFQVTCQRNTTSNNESPWGHVREITNTGKSVRVQVKRSNTGEILLGGTYSGNGNNDNAVNVYLTVMGVLA